MTKTYDYHLQELKSHLEELLAEGYEGDLQDLAEELYGEHEDFCEAEDQDPTEADDLISFSAGVFLGKLEALEA